MLLRWRNVYALWMISDDPVSYDERQIDVVAATTQIWICTANPFSALAESLAKELLGVRNSTSMFKGSY